MVVHALRGVRAGPRLAHRRRAAHDGRNADWGAGEWLVVEADESDRSLLRCDAEHRGADERRARPPRDVRARCAELERGLPRVPRAAAPRVVWDRPELLALRDGAGVVASDAGDVDADRRRLALRLARAARCACRARARTTRSTPPRRSTALRARRAPTPTPRPRRWRTSAAPGAASSALGTTRVGRARLRRLRPPPDRGRGDARRRAHARAAGGSSPSSSRTCSRARSSSRASSARRWPPPTSSCVLDVYPARERAEDFPGVSGLADRRGGRGRRGRAAGLLAAAASTTPRRSSPALLRDGDLCLVMGAGRRRRARAQPRRRLAPA